MNASTQSSIAELRDGATQLADRPCKIVFFWEDFDAAIHARKSFDSVVEHFSGGRPVAASTWSFSMLESPEFNASVLMDASRADVIVVAARGDEEVSARIASWLEICVMREEGPPAVVVALHDDRLKDNGGAAPFCSSVKKITKRQGASFACSKDLKGNVARGSRKRAPRCDAHPTIHLGEPARAADAGIHRWSGIND